MATETFISYPNLVNNDCSEGMGGIIFSTDIKDTTIKAAELWSRGGSGDSGSGPLFHASRSYEYTYSSVGPNGRSIVFNRWIMVNEGSNLIKVYCTGSKIYVARWEAWYGCKLYCYYNPHVVVFSDNRKYCTCDYKITSWFSSSIPKGDAMELWASESWRLTNVNPSSTSWYAAGFSYSIEYYFPISSIPAGTPASFTFELNERNYWESKVKGFSPVTTLNSQFSAAFYDAFDRMPDASCNSIATVLEVAGALAKLFRGDFGSLIKLTGPSLWLQYRYVVNTTKMDIAEYRSLTERLVSLASSDTIKCYGAVSDQYGTYRCCIELTADQVLPQGTVSLLKSFGFELSLVNAWDMIPYSFVVDWFLHIGPLLEDLEKAKKAREYRYQNIWYTADLKYGTPLQSVFLRFREVEPPQPAYFQYRETSKKTLLMRLTDAACMIAQKGD